MDLRRAVLGTLILSGKTLDSPDARRVLGWPQTDLWLPLPEDQEFLVRMEKIRAVSRSDPETAARMATALLGIGARGAIEGLQGHAGQDFFVILRDFPVGSSIPTYPKIPQEVSGVGRREFAWVLGTDPNSEPPTYDDVMQHVLWGNPELQEDLSVQAHFRQWLEQSTAGDSYEDLYEVYYVLRLSLERMEIT